MPLAVREGILDPTPAPWDYRPFTFVTERGLGPAITIAAGPRALPDQQSGVPPVGSYEPYPAAGNGPAYTMAARLKAQELTSDTPPPGSYNPYSAAGNGPAYTMAARLKAQELTSDTPPPGYYNPLASEAGHGPAFTIAGRVKVQDKVSDVPPPGYYNPHASEAGSGPAFTMGARIWSRDKPSDVPPPGAFGPFAPIDTCKAPLPGRNRFDSLQVPTMHATWVAGALPGR